MRFPLAAVLAVAMAGAAPANAQTTEPVAGLWHLSGGVVATACADRCVTRRQAIDEDIVVTNAGVSGAEGFAAGCGGAVSTEEFDGLLTLVTGRRGWLRIRILDRPRFRRLMRACIGYRSLRLARFSGRVRIAPDGRSLDEVAFVAGSVSAYGRTATFSAKGRLHAEWVREAPASAATLRPALLAGVLDAALAAE
jgi:hypothetical protein